MANGLHGIQKGGCRVKNCRGDKCIGSNREDRANSMFMMSDEEKKIRERIRDIDDEIKELESERGAVNFDGYDDKIKGYISEEYDADEVDAYLRTEIYYDYNYADSLHRDLKDDCYEIGKLTLSLNVHQDYENTKEGLGDPCFLKILNNEDMGLDKSVEAIKELMVDNAESILDTRISTKKYLKEILERKLTDD